MSVPRCVACGCWRAYDLKTCGCAYWAQRALERAEGRRCRECSTLLPEDHGYSRCDPCHAARSDRDFEYRRRSSAARFPAGVRRLLVVRVAAGEHLTDVCADLGATQQQVHGYKTYSAEWAEALDQALMAGRDPKLDHGSMNAYRHGRCRCPECREYKLNHDGWWRRPGRITRQRATAR
ncbi:hypothetical protein ACFTZI_32470 [Streptomyces decoyicus]|uniref:hypothetical protein n=1 Tax=Streptomyces decoyicus TaxID=249567 RepID=UPI00362C7AA4